jgi:hypothetical protein
MCYRAAGCSGSTCITTPDIGASCGGANVCLMDGSCGVAPPIGQFFDYTPSNFDPTLLTVPQGRVVISGQAGFDTSSNTFTGTWPANRPAVSVVTTPTGPAVILAAEGFDVLSGATFRVVGDKPLIVASTETIEVYGTIDVSAYWSGATPVPGPGGNVNCGTATGTSGTPGTNSAEGGGGAGGAAGPGGPGGGGSTFSGGGGPAGTQRTGASGNLIAGCAGGTGGNLGGTAGAGGGALQLSSSYGIAIDAAAIFANGIGGKGGTGTGTGGVGANGGGGAGSGGTILLEAPYVFARNSSIIAEGGGGGEGAGRLAAGQNGADGARGYSFWGAQGGSGFSGNGGNGGMGGGQNNPAYPGRPGTQYDDGNSSFFEAGGGGGGGAAGKIHVNVTTGGRCIIPHEHVWQSPRLSNNDSTFNCYY